MNINQEKLKQICGPTIYNNIPHYKIELFDISYNRYFDKETEEILPKGGQTVCAMKIDGQEYIGIAFCSKKDNFCKKEGRKIAMLRAFTHYWDYVKSIKSITSSGVQI
jgi:hypothetical protein